jgi:hypothetical protein
VKKSLLVMEMSLLDIQAPGFHIEPRIALRGWNVLPQYGGNF